MDYEIHLHVKTVKDREASAVTNAVVKVTDTPVDAMTTLMPADCDKHGIQTLRGDDVLALFGYMVKCHKYWPSVRSNHAAYSLSVIFRVT